MTALIDARAVRDLAMEHKAKPVNLKLLGDIESVILNVAKLGRRSATYTLWGAGRVAQADNIIKVLTEHGFEAECNPDKGSHRGRAALVTCAVIEIRW